ncbi:MAG: tripartite tricarboxylate transporter TctB family protein [Methanothrix sp.]|nr:tripartite tricarboxylate transporter TctB family protein [Methanothrix sp.]
MHWKYQIAACCFLAFSAYLMWESWNNMEYYTPLGPGAGFFPFWLGALLGGLGIIWLVQVSRRSGYAEEGPSLPPRGGIVRILSIVFSVAVVSALLDLLGFQLTMFLFMLFMLLILGRQTIWTTLIIALVCSVGVYHMFGRYLDVQLPKSSLTFLANLGL